MTDTIKTWRAEPLAWGRGSRQFEMFLEPTCPYSARAFTKLDETLAVAGSDNITIKIWLHSQPWHMYSGVVVRCVLAASTLPTGKEAAKAVLAAVVAHRRRPYGRYGWRPRALARKNSPGSIGGGQSSS